MMGKEIPNFLGIYSKTTVEKLQAYVYMKLLLPASEKLVFQLQECARGKSLHLTN